MADGGQVVRAFDGLAGRLRARLPVGWLRPLVRPNAVAREMLLWQFESLGENCELGFVQDYLGVHPLGLFRWSGIKLGQLITALETNLAGIGEAANTAVSCEDIRGEYYVRDIRYGMLTHTRMFRDKHSAEDVMFVFGQRSRRLCEKLLEDIKGAEKIFVFQSMFRVDESEMVRLHLAIRRIGPTAELLFIHPAQSGQRPGTVQRLRPGLMLGLLDRAGFDGSTWQISWQIWLSILARAAKLCGRRASRLATADLSALNLPRKF